MREKKKTIFLFSSGLWHADTNRPKVKYWIKFLLEVIYNNTLLDFEYLSTKTPCNIGNT